MGTSILPLNAATLESVCKVLGDTNRGFTGDQIGRLLSERGIPDIDPAITKWRRLHAALGALQKRDNAANGVLNLIQSAMDPARYTNDHAAFEERRAALNSVLAFSGFNVHENGRVRRVAPARTLSEAQDCASRLRAELVSRKVHHDVLRFCKAELLQENYFHAVLEATKSVADKIRALSGLTLDGSDLIDAAFSTRAPRIAINSLRTVSEKSEHTGLMNMIKGIFGAFRNTTAHEPKIKWQVNEADALDILSMVSLIHRKLDNATTVPQQPPTT